MIEVAPLQLNPRGEIRQSADGTWFLRCPQCGHWGEIDDDQLNGRTVSDHTNCQAVWGHSDGHCTFIDIRDWFNTADRLTDEQAAALNAEANVPVKPADPLKETDGS